MGDMSVSEWPDTIRAGGCEQLEPLVRRVLTPAQLDLAPVLPAHGETSSAQTLTVTDPADPAAVVGYRLTAFYP